MIARSIHGRARTTRPTRAIRLRPPISAMFLCAMPLLPERAGTTASTRLPSIATRDPPPPELYLRFMRLPNLIPGDLPMEFDFDPTERDVIERARHFAEAHVAPHAAAWEHERRVPVETLRAACAAGLAEIELAKNWGGPGLRFSCKLRAYEEIARHDYAFAFSLMNHHNALVRLARDGQASLVERLLPLMRRGEIFGCAGLSEPGAGSDFAAITTSARKVDGGWILDGAKAWITNAAVAGVSACFAPTHPRARGRGIGILLVER